MVSSTCWIKLAGELGGTVGEGKISVSDRFSRAGARSIRWDWKAGDVIRIKDAGIVSNVRVGYTGFGARSEEIAPFALSIFQDQGRVPATRTRPSISTSSGARITENGENELKLTRAALLS